MAEVFVTGASGFVGRTLVPALEARGHRVTCLAGRRAGGHEDTSALLDVAVHRKALEAMDVVIHLAAATGKCPRDVCFRTNVDGTQALVNGALAAAKPHFVFASSIAVTFADTAHYPYAQSKAVAERVVVESGLPYTIIRPTMIGGNGSPVFTGLARLAGLPVIPAFAGARARVQPIHVNDLCTLLGDVLESRASRGQTLEFGGRDVVSLRALLEQLHVRMKGKAARVVHVPLAPLLPMLALAERVAYAAVPLTIGQLATFRFDGVATPNPFWQARFDQLTDLATMVDQGVPS